LVTLLFTLNPRFQYGSYSASARAVVARAALTSYAKCIGRGVVVWLQPR